MGLYCLLCSSLATSPVVTLQPNHAEQELVVLVDGQPALAYRYADEYALPHYFPIRSPSGKSLTIQRPTRYPHHRSLWIADKVQAASRPLVDFYHCWRNQRDPKDPAVGFDHFIRHQRFAELKAEGATAIIQAELQWIINDKVPVLAEHRTLRVVGLQNREYFAELTWKLTAVDGWVTFHSDAVHYAWPYVRMHPQFSGESGGQITNDRGHFGQAETHGKTAAWIDYSNTVDGETEGLALFVHPNDGPRKWLTREYGTFGPRRPEAYNGTKFTLRKGETLQGRVGILVHRGDATSGQIAKRYQQYVKGDL